MTNQHADYDEPTHDWVRLINFTFLIACLHLHSDKQCYT